jgi:hypothetical protein
MITAKKPRNKATSRLPSPAPVLPAAKAEEEKVNRAIRVLRNVVFMASSYDDADDQQVFVLTCYKAKSVPTSGKGHEILHNKLIV